MNAIFKPRYANAIEIDKAIRSINTRGQTFRRDLDDLLNSAIAHHEALLPNGSSIGTVLSKVYVTIAKLGFINHRGIKAKLLAVFGPELAWSNKNKTFSGKTEFNATFQNGDKVVHYSEAPFWDMKVEKEKKDWDWETILTNVFNGKSVDKRIGDMTAKQRERFQAYRELCGLLTDKIVTPADACQYASGLRARVNGKGADDNKPRRQRRIKMEEGALVAIN